jgi:hypothetical protein
MMQAAVERAAGPVYYYAGKPCTPKLRSPHLQVRHLERHGVAEVQERLVDLGAAVRR